MTTNADNEPNRFDLLELDPADRRTPPARTPQAPAAPDPTPVATRPAAPPRDFADVANAIDTRAQRSPVAPQQRGPATPTNARSTAETPASASPARAEPVLRKGDIVAGAAAAGSGVLLGFAGRGKLTRRELLAALLAAGLPADWAPSSKSAHAQAGRIVGGLNSLGYVVRADRTKSQQRKLAQTAEAEVLAAMMRDQKEEGQHARADKLAQRARELNVQLPTWSARWIVSATTRVANVGDAAGKVVMIATLDANDELWLDSSNSELSGRVRAEFQSRIAAEEYSASDVSDWLKSTLVHRFRAARLGGNYYVKQQHAHAAESLLTAFSRRWGQDFLLPALPVATSEQLRAGIAANFADEVQAVLADYLEKRDAAIAEGKQLSSRVAQSIHAKLREVTERAVGFAALVGERHVRDLRLRCVTASNEISESIDGITQRFDLIFDELAREAR